MKNLILVSLLSLAPLAATVGTASASGLVCNEGPKLNIMEPTYRAVISTDSRHARILQVTPRDIDKIADLDCAAVRFDGSPNVDHTDLRCADPVGDDAGYVLEINSGGVVGVAASLSRRTKTGSEPLAFMLCQYE